MEREMLKQMISEYRSKVTTYQAMIAEWERELGLPNATPSANGVSEKPERGLNVEVQPWQFMGKSQPEAAKALLTMVGHPLTTEDIADGIRRGGVVVKGQKNTFYAILNRSDEFARFGRNTWGLADWPGRKTVRKKREKKSEPESSKRKAAQSKSSRDNVGAAVREVMKDGKLRSKDQIIKAVEQHVGRSIKPIAVFGSLRNKDFVQVDGQYRLAG